MYANLYQNFETPMNLTRVSTKISSFNKKLKSISYLPKQNKSNKTELLKPYF